MAQLSTSFKKKNNLREASSDKKVELEGFFDMHKTYNTLCEWLEDLTYEISPKDLIEKNDPGQRELEVYVDGHRMYSDYCKFYLSFSLFMNGIDQDIIQEDGSKVTKTYGKARVIVSLYFELDPYHKKHYGKWMKFFLNFYEKFFFKEKLSFIYMAGADEASNFTKVFREQISGEIK